MSVAQIRDLPGLLGEVEELFARLLSDGRSWPINELERRIPDDLAEARCQLTSPLVYSDLPDPKDFGRCSLATDVLKSLEAVGKCERRRFDGLEEIRLAGLPEPSRDLDQSKPQLDGPEVRPNADHQARTLSEDQATTGQDPKDAPKARGKKAKRNKPIAGPKPLPPLRRIRNWSALDIF
jgi:hypothetical protein